MNRSIAIEHDGVTYHAEIGRITRTFLGREDHGIFTAYMTFEGPNWGQSDPPRALGGASLFRYIDAVLSVLGVDQWEKVLGQKAFVLRDAPSGLIQGIAHHMEDRILLFDDIFAEATPPPS